MTQQETTSTGRRGRGRARVTAGAGQDGDHGVDVPAPEAGMDGGEAPVGGTVTPEPEDHAQDGEAGTAEEHAAAGASAAALEESEPVHRSVGYGAMSSGGAPPAGARPYGGDRSGARGQGGYARSGYGGRGTAEKSYPSEHQVKEISARGIPVPPSYAEAQALLDSFEPSPAQQKRLDENGLTAATRGEAKEVLARLVAENPDIAARWEAENARGRVARRQERRGDADPTVTTPGMYKLLAESGVQNVPTDYATAAAMIDGLAPSDNMVRVLREHGRAVPETRAEATEIIRGLPATPDQIVTIMRRTGGRWAPKTRGEAERWFNSNPRDRGASAPAEERIAA